MTAMIFPFTMSILTFIFLPFNCSATCPSYSGNTDVNLTKLSGIWFVVAATPVRESVGKCLKFNITKNDDGSFKMNFTSVSYITNQFVWWDVQGEQNGSDLIATWQIYPSPRRVGPFEHQILEADYDAYVVLLICGPNNEFIHGGRFALILSRTKSLSTKILLDRKKTISTYVNEDDIVDVDHSRECEIT